MRLSGRPRLDQSPALSWRMFGLLIACRRYMTEEDAKLGWNLRLQDSDAVVTESRGEQLLHRWKGLSKINRNSILMRARHMSVMLPYVQLHLFSCPTSIHPMKRPSNRQSLSDIQTPVLLRSSTHVQLCVLQHVFYSEPPPIQRQRPSAAATKEGRVEAATYQVACKCTISEFM